MLVRWFDSRLCRCVVGNLRIGLQYSNPTTGAVVGYGSKRAYPSEVRGVESSFSTSGQSLTRASQPHHEADRRGLTLPSLSRLVFPFDLPFLSLTLSLCRWAALRPYGPRECFAAAVDLGVPIKALRRACSLAGRFYLTPFSLSAPPFAGPMVPTAEATPT